MSDESIVCVECKASFVFYERDAVFYASKGLNKPKRCKPCRDARKARQSTDSIPATNVKPAQAPRRTEWVNGADFNPVPRRNNRSKRTPRHTHDYDDG